MPPDISHKTEVYLQQRYAFAQPRWRIRSKATGRIRSATWRAFAQRLWTHSSACAERIVQPRWHNHRYNSAQTPTEANRCHLILHIRQRYTFNNGTNRLGAFVRRPLGASVSWRWTHSVSHLAHSVKRQLKQKPRDISHKTKVYLQQLVQNDLTHSFGHIGAYSFSHVGALAQSIGRIRSKATWRIRRLALDTFAHCQGITLLKRQLRPTDAT